MYIVMVDGIALYALYANNDDILKLTGNSYFESFQKINYLK